MQRDTSRLHFLCCKKRGCGSMPKSLQSLSTSILRAEGFCPTLFYSNSFPFAMTKDFSTPHCVHCQVHSLSPLPLSASSSLYCQTIANTCKQLMIFLNQKAAMRGFSVSIGTAGGSREGSPPPALLECTTSHFY